MLVIRSIRDHFRTSGVYYKYLGVSCPVVNNGLSDAVVFFSGIKYDLVLKKETLIDIYGNFTNFWLLELFDFGYLKKGCFSRQVKTCLSNRKVSDLHPLYFVDVWMSQLFGSLFDYCQWNTLITLFVYGPIFGVFSFRYAMYKNLFVLLSKLIASGGKSFEEFALFIDALYFKKIGYIGLFVNVLLRFFLYRRKRPNRRGYYKFVFKIMSRFKSRKVSYRFKSNRLMGHKVNFKQKLVN